MTDDHANALFGTREALRHKEAELAYLTQQRKKVKQEVKSLRRLLKSLEQ